MRRTPTPVHLPARHYLATDSLTPPPSPAWTSLRLGHASPPAPPPPALAQPPRLRTIPAVCRLPSYPRSAAARPPAARLAVPARPNGGRPGGACGAPGGGLDEGSIHLRHVTQEESLVSNWLLSAAPGSSAARAALFDAAVGGAWGLRDPLGADGATRQGVDYRAECGATAPPAAARLYADAWAAAGCRLCAVMPSGRGHGSVTDTSRSCTATLVFAAGPNAMSDHELRAAHRGATSSVTRTRSRAAEQSYDFLLEGVRWALRAAFEAAAADGCRVVLVARISGGLYAGAWRRRLATEYESVVDAVLAEAVAAGATMLKPGQKTSWGGYSGYFDDPDGFLWEVAWNPHFTIE